MTPCITLFHEIANILLQTLAQIDREKFALLKTVDQGKMVKPKLKVMPFDERIGFLAVQDLE